MPTILTELHYFPCVAYFAQLRASQTVCLETCEHYTKQTYRNRCYVLGANRIERLTVPVLTPSGMKIPITEVLIDNRQRWQAVHWRTILAAYGKAPYFVHYAPLLQEVFEKPYTHLFTLNETLIKKICQLLQFSIHWQYTESYQTFYEPLILNDLRNQQPLYNEVPMLPFYRQVFGNQFINNLSILDLLFCKGNQAINFIKI